MKTYKREMTAGWSFVIGTISGGLAAFVLSSWMQGPALKAEARNSSRPAAVEPARSQSAGVIPAASDADTGTTPGRVLEGHSELDLQLD